MAGGFSSRGCIGRDGKVIGINEKVDVRALAGGEEGRKVRLARIYRDWRGSWNRLNVTGREKLLWLVCQEAHR